jgi:hypothetical protein
MVSKSFYVRNGLIVGAASVDALTGNITTPGTLAASTATFTGVVTAPTPATLDNSTKLATTAFVQSAVAAVSGASTAGTITYNPIQVATAGQTVFTVPSGYASNLIMVYVNGYKLPPSDYTAVNGNSITLKVGSNVNDELETVVFSAQVMGATSTLQRTSVIATAAQTTFSVTYPVGMILVKVNGLIVPTTDYTAVDGISVTLATGVPIGTEIEFLVFSAMNLVNAVPSTGGSMTGALSVAADVSMSSLNSGQLAGMRNRIINGDMRVSQRSGSTLISPTVTGGTYTVDRFYMQCPVLSKLTAQRVTDAPAGLKYSTKISVDTQYSPAAGEEWIFRQVIEGQNIADLQLGLATAQVVTFSMWVKGSVAGTYSLHFVSATRSYVGTINVTSAWTRQSITLTCDTTGTWATTIAAGVYLGIDLGSGSNFNNTANTWIAGSARRTADSVTLVNQVAGSTLNITGVQLELGTIATPFEQRPYGMELALCQRYYEVKTLDVFGYAGAAGRSIGSRFNYLVDKRLAPTIIQIINNVNFSSVNVTASTSTYFSGSTEGVTVYRSSTAADNSQFSETISASAEL